jgi:hypothetical protein
MPTTKTRINLSVTPELNKILEKLADRDQTSVSAKTLELVRVALEIEEDLALLQAVQVREKIKGKFIAHDVAWI